MDRGFPLPLSCFVLPYFIVDVSFTSFYFFSLPFFLYLGDAYGNTAVPERSIPISSHPTVVEDSERRHYLLCPCALFIYFVFYVFVLFALFFCRSFVFPLWIRRFLCFTPSYYFGAVRSIDQKIMPGWRSTAQLTTIKECAVTVGTLSRQSSAGWKGSLRSWAFTEMQVCSGKRWLTVSKRFR